MVLFFFLLNSFSFCVTSSLTLSVVCLGYLSTPVSCWLLSVHLYISLSVLLPCCGSVGCVSLNTSLDLHYMFQDNLQWQMFFFFFFFVNKWHFSSLLSPWSQFWPELCVHFWEKSDFVLCFWLLVFPTGNCEIPIFKFSSTRQPLLLCSGNVC